MTLISFVILIAVASPLNTSDRLYSHGDCSFHFFASLTHQLDVDASWPPLTRERLFEPELWLEKYKSYDLLLSHSFGVYLPRLLLYPAQIIFENLSIWPRNYYEYILIVAQSPLDHYSWATTSLSIPTQPPRQMRCWPRL